MTELQINNKHEHINPNHQNNRFSQLIAGDAIEDTKGKMDWHWLFFVVSWFYTGSEYGDRCLIFASWEISFVWFPREQNTISAEG